ncbi:TRAP transporter substrate-binding protein DctP [Pelagibius marinus]|uniref:TRAP transporter substrate-binding protein DctP n=1 Tax=Pelagibius marinus TaxID=2762760 RepID=UPI001872C98C|nr:TRAP transporter substrate-binding protein DctP [Pelagibius marinus]
MIKIRLAAAVAGALALTGAASAQELTLKYAVHTPEANIISEGNQYFADRVAELSDGRIKVEVYWNRALGKQQEMLPLISAGAVDFTTLETAQYGETPLMGFMNTIFPVHRDAVKLTEMSNWLYQHSTGIKAELDRIGAKPLFVQHLPHYQLLCTKPFRKIADFDGAKLRAFGAYVPVMWQSLGANAVNVVTNEMYDGLDKGVFDCTFLPPPFLNSLKLYEVAKYLIDVPFGMIEFAPTLVSTTNWNQWSAEDQAIIMQAAADAEIYSLNNTNAKSDQAVQSLVANGAEIVHFEETEQLLASVPDLMQVWLNRQTEEGRGEAAEQIVTYARKALAESQ